MTYRFVVNALIHCATLLDNIIGKEIQYILLFISMGSIVCHNMKFYLLNAVKTTNVYTHMEQRFIFQDQYVFLHFALKECFMWEDRTKSKCTFTEEQINHKAAVLKMAQEFNVNSFVLKQPQLLFCTRSLIQYSEKMILIAISMKKKQFICKNCLRRS